MGGSQVRGQPQQLSETLFQNKIGLEMGGGARRIRVRGQPQHSLSLSLCLSLST